MAWNKKMKAGNSSKCKHRSRSSGTNAGEIFLRLY